MLKNRIILILLLFSLTGLDHVSAKERGTTYGNFLRINPYVHSVGMGNNIPLDNSDVMSLYLNPALLLNITGDTIINADNPKNIYTHQDEYT